MAYVMVRHRVVDYEKWKQMFDSDQETIGQAGFKKYGLYRTVEDPNNLVLFFEVSDIDKVKEFMTSDFAKNRMKEGTVVGTPELVFLDQLEKKLIGIHEKAA